MFKQKVSLGEEDCEPERERELGNMLQIISETFQSREHCWYSGESFLEGGTGTKLLNLLKFSAKLIHLCVHL